MTSRTWRTASKRKSGSTWRLSHPPWWASVLMVVGWGLVSLVFGVTVMAQWVLWMVLGSSFLGVAGIALGGLVAAVQMWLLFGTPNVNESCDLP